MHSQRKFTVLETDWAMFESTSYYISFVGHNKKDLEDNALGLFYWWPLCESNTAPTDSGL